MDAKVFQENFGSAGFTTSLVKPQMVKEVGDKEAAHTKTGRNELGRLVGEEEAPQRQPVIARLATW